MKPKTLMCAALIACAGVTGAATAAPVKAKAAKPATSAGARSIAAIQATLAKVTDDGEQTRWNRNLGLWKHAIVDKKGDLKAVDYEAFTPEKAELTGAIAGLPENDEKERWECDEALWQFVVDTHGDLVQADAAQVRKWYGKMVREVAKVKEPGEKTRWTQNIALWKSVLPKTVTAPAK